MFFPEKNTVLFLKNPFQVERKKKEEEASDKVWNSPNTEFDLLN